jgi:hypothetical protein
MPNMDVYMNCVQQYYTYGLSTYVHIWCIVNCNMYQYTNKENFGMPVMWFFLQSCYARAPYAKSAVLRVVFIFHSLKCNALFPDP